MATLVLLNDVLRLTDNPLLCQRQLLRLAPDSADELKIAVLLLDPAQWLASADYAKGQCQLPRATPQRLQQQLALIEFFRQQLAEHGIALHCIWQSARTAIRMLQDLYAAKRLVMAQPVGSEESAWLAEWSTHIAVHTLDANSLLTGSLAPKSGQLPRTFSQFRRAREPELAVGAVEPVLLEANWCAHCPTAITQGWQDAVLHYAPTIFDASHDSIQSHPLPTEPQQQQRCQQYLFEQKAILHYKASRNEFFGEWYASFFSTALARGTLSARWIWQQIQQFEQRFGVSESSYWLRFELLWREYFRWQCRAIGSQQFCFIGQSHQPLPLPEGTTAEQLGRFRRWCSASTGVPIVDANMRLLQQTGLMSNRGRQIVASYLIFDLALDWRWGAAYFEQQLLDYDVASNWGNWAYIAGAGTQAGRWFNSIKQALEYDPAGNFVRQMLPHLSGAGALIHQPYAVAGAAAPTHPGWQPWLEQLQRANKAVIAANAAPSPLEQPC